MSLNSSGDSHPNRVLLTGATGYVGGRLLPLLENAGVTVRCLARRPEELESRVSGTTEVVTGNVLERDSLTSAFEGVHTAYYLVHSMGSRDDFEELDRQAARNFAAAATQAGVQRIIYLGALGTPDPNLSKHLRSRQEVGDLLRQSTAQVIEFRASIVIGSGSLSFELIRSLTERLPVMICPRWVRTLAQPIAIEDLLKYLLEAMDLEGNSSRIYEVGGPEVVSYAGIIQEYARQRGLRRVMIPVPVLTPGLSSRWLGLVTPLYSRIGRKLIEGLRNPTLVSSNLAEKTFSVRPIGLSKSIERALKNEDQRIAETRWSDALSSGGSAPKWGGVRFGSRLLDSRTRPVSVPPSQAFAPIQRIGGTTGWYYGTWLWKIRGWLDLLVGGIGLRRGRRDPKDLRVGDTLDFWRVEAYEPNHRLRLRAEMKVPGRAWLEFEVSGDDDGSHIRQTATFDPIGLFGIVYWYSVWPLHQFVFAGMLRNIAHAAEGLGATPMKSQEPQSAIVS
ncbi:SDR family oxidoreductase [Thalassoroseus pseudoceratinae]|uniref:SDR family oxidoreductase n=1 Tax=Thalassoroseus pseudoceratinae TaxID=2713176 RepID=UPI0014230B2E|nr:SDR family oxidoreductase [Thalassoroseus pseudoceratinae]